MKCRVIDWKFGEQIVLYVSSQQEYEKFSKRNGSKIIRLGKNKILFIREDKKQEFCLESVEDIEYSSGDILEIHSSGLISFLQDSETDEIDLFITNKCNSNCVMCPLADAVRRKDNGSSYDWLKQYIDILPDNISYINITGGEPTLAKENFEQLLQLLKNKFQHSDFQLLTNGRSAADEEFLRRILSSCPTGIRFAIPVHSANEIIHDEITRAKGSFKQTDRGIKNLLKYDQKVEVRIVVSAKNVDYMLETAEYIEKNYKNVFCVNFMAMEMMGNAARNRKDLWIDYPEAFKKCKAAVDYLVRSGIDVQLYNFPLCAVDRGYWHIAAKSISNYKVRFMDECIDCKVQEICGGFFSSTKNIMHPAVRPIR